MTNQNIDTPYQQLQTKEKTLRRLYRLAATMLFLSFFSTALAIFIHTRSSFNELDSMDTKNQTKEAKYDQMDLASIVAGFIR